MSSFQLIKWAAHIRENLQQKICVVYCLINFYSQSATYSTFVHKAPNLIQMKQEFKCLRVDYVILGSYFLYKKLPIRSFIFSEINTFGRPKFRKENVAFNIFVPIPFQEMVYSTKKSLQWTLLLREPSIKRRIWKKFIGSFSPLAPLLDPPMQYLHTKTAVRLSHPIAHAWHTKLISL